MDRQHGVGMAVQLHGTSREWSIRVEAQKGIEPDQTAAVPFQPLQIFLKGFGCACIQAIADQHHYRSSTDQQAFMVAL